MRLRSTTQRVTQEVPVASEGCKLKQPGYGAGVHHVTNPHGDRHFILHVPSRQEVLFEATERVLKDEGGAIADHSDRHYSLDECKTFCVTSPNCSSFAYSAEYGSCHLKDKCVEVGEPIVSASKFRTYYKSCTMQAPLWVLAPGDSWTAEEFLRKSGFGTFAKERQILFVLLQGPLNGAEYVKFAIHSVAGKLCVDFDRIWCFGFSGGAQLCSRIALELPHYFAALSLVSGVHAPAPNSSAQPMPLLAFHGTDDSIHPYMTSLGPAWTTSVEGSVQRWAALNGCSQHRWQITQSPHVLVWHHSECLDHAEVRLYRIEHGGHGWPGPSLDPSLAKVANLDANEITWQFFREHSRSPARPPRYPCSCPYGSPAPGASCLRRGEVRCARCREGFPLARGSCATTRLVGGTRGQLEVFQDDRWQPVCDDGSGFDAESARAACRELGLSGGRVLPRRGAGGGAVAGLCGPSSWAVALECASTGARGVRYVAGSDGANRCPQRTVALGRSECAGMPGQLGGALNGLDWEIHSSIDPKGCFRFDEGSLALYYYNTHPTGAGRGKRTPYCKSEHDVLYILGDAGNASCPHGALDLTEAECAAMPDWFGGGLQEPFVINSTSDPRGCFRKDGAGFHFNAHRDGANRSGAVVHCKLPYHVDITVGTSGSSRCPEGSDTLSEVECRGAPQELEVLLREPLVIRSATQPRGCARVGGVVAYNAHPTGAGAADATPLCGHAAHGAGYLVSGGECPPGTLALGEAECRDLPAHLGGKLAERFVVDTAEEPRGCFGSLAAEGGYRYNRHLSGGSWPGNAACCRLAYDLEYVSGGEGNGQCPPGTVVLSEAECRNAPLWLGGTLREPFVIGFANYPRGCVRSAGLFSYNMDPTGSGHRDWTPLCKRDDR